MTNANTNRWNKKVYLRNQQWAFVVFGQQKYMMGFIVKNKMTINNAMQQTSYNKQQIWKDGQ
jgi:hypothetical protein